MFIHFLMVYFFSTQRRKKMASHDRELLPYDAELDSVPCFYFPGG
jgi:hypothetical protein